MLHVILSFTRGLVFHDKFQTDKTYVQIIDTRNGESDKMHRKKVILELWLCSK